MNGKLRQTHITAMHQCVLPFQPLWKPTKPEEIKKEEDKVAEELRLEKIRSDVNN